jgi:hypothetical protein
MTNFDKRLNFSWWALKIGLGVGPIITGIDKYFNKLTDWTMYLGPLATKVVPISAATFMHLVGAVEILAGILVLSRWTKPAVRLWGFGWSVSPPICWPGMFMTSCATSKLPSALCSFTTLRGP